MNSRFGPYNGSMPRRSKTTRWLDAEEAAAWRAISFVMHRLTWALECQLERDADLSYIEYYTLVRLSEEPNHTLRMSGLAIVTNQSLSRLSHLVKRLETRGLLRRETDASDGRFTNAILTDKGFKTLAGAAPGHVAHVRSLVIDVLSPEQLRRLGLAADRIVSRIDTSAID